MTRGRGTSLADELTDGAPRSPRTPRPGKIEVVPTKPLATQLDLSLAYSPGVAAACNEIVRDPANVQCLNVDKQTPQVYVKTRPRLATTEFGSTATYHMRLTVAPTADVVCPIASSDTTEDTANPASLTFTSAAFALQAVAVKGVPDGVKDGDQLITIVNGACTSLDPSYNGLDPNDVMVVNRDIN